MITDSNNNKISAKVKVKLLLKEYLDAFILVNEENWSKGDLIRIEEQIIKIKERLYRNLIVKIEE